MKLASIALMVKHTTLSRNSNFYFFITLSVYYVAEDGFIDEGDLRKTMIQLRLKFTDSDVDEMLNECAPNGKGPRRIDFDDFLTVMT